MTTEIVPRPTRLIVTVHGIRTFGRWQERLERLLPVGGGALRHQQANQDQAEAAVGKVHRQHGAFAVVPVHPGAGERGREYRRQGERQSTCSDRDGKRRLVLRSRIQHLGQPDGDGEKGDRAAKDRDGLGGPDDQKGPKAMGRGLVVQVVLQAYALVSAIRLRRLNGRMSVQTSRI